LQQKITKRGDDPEFLRVPEQFLLIRISSGFKSPSDDFLKGGLKKIPRSALKPLDASTTSGRPGGCYYQPSIMLIDLHCSYGLSLLCANRTIGNIRPSLLFENLKFKSKKKYDL